MRYDDLIVPATTSPRRHPSGADEDELLVFEDRERLLEHLSRPSDPAPQEEHVPGLRELRHDLGKELDLLQLLVEAAPESGDEGQSWQAVRRQVAVIREVLDDAVDPSPDEVDVTELARGISSTMSAAHGRDILLHTTGIGVVHGNRGLLRRVLVNLLDNARLASPRGRVQVQVHALRRGVLVEVEDDGSGGGTEPSRPAGSGLGLPIVRDIAAWHGGGTCCGASSLGGRRVVVALPQAVAT